MSDIKVTQAEIDLLLNSADVLAEDWEIAEVRHG